VIGLNERISLEVFERPASQYKQNTRFKESYTYFGCETKTGIVRILAILQDGPMLIHINGKLLPRRFK